MFNIIVIVIFILYYIRNLILILNENSVCFDFLLKIDKFILEIFLYTVYTLNLSKWKSDRKGSARSRRVSQRFFFERC